MKRLLIPLLALSTIFLASCKNNQVSKINISCKLSYEGGKEEDVHFEKFLIDTEDNLAIIETTFPAVFSTRLNKQLEEETQKRLGNLTVNSKKYIIQVERKEGGYQYRDTYSFDKNDVSKVKTIFEVKEDSNYVIDKYGTYEVDCVKEK
tara:strand:- start:15 stop:461 length:447 start_codon:yes stop_codon:yes gene_type:complete